MYSNKCAGASARGGVGARSRWRAGARKSLRVASGVRARARAREQVCGSRAMAYAGTREREAVCPFAIAQDSVRERERARL